MYASEISLWQQCKELRYSGKSKETLNIAYEISYHFDWPGRHMPHYSKEKQSYLPL